MSQYNISITNPNHANDASAIAPMVFNGINLSPVERDGQIWITASDLAKALSYSRSDKVTQIYSRNADEFTDAMTLNLNLRVKGFGNGSSKKIVRVFSLRGCHLIAMFANTNIAKSFRKWVLDILDREVGTPVAEQPPAITDADWQRYSRSMTIPEMAQFTGHTEQQVINALHDIMGSTVRATSPAPVMTPELQYALDQFWRFVATQDMATLDHSQHRSEMAISIPDIYDLAENWQLPDPSTLYQALRLSTLPRFSHANIVVHSDLLKKSRRVWLFLKPSVNQMQAIGVQ